MSARSTPSAARPDDAQIVAEDRAIVLKPRHPAVMVVLVVLWAAFSAFSWSASSPIGASPDEPAHITYSWGVVSGQVLPWNLSTTTADSGKTLAEINVPLALENFPDPSCYAYGATYNTTNCPIPDNDSGSVWTTSYMTRYPVFYYAYTGLFLGLGQALALSGFATLFLARFFSGVLCYSVVALTASLTGRRYGWRPAGAVLALAMVPTAQFLFSSINPNGAEIALAMLLTSIVLAIRHDILHTGRASTALQIGAPLAMLALGSTRPLSIAWAGLIICVLLLPVNGRPLLLQLRHWCSLALVGVATFCLGWLVYQASGTMTETSVGDVADWEALSTPVKVVSVFLRFGTMIRQSFGTLGWLDTDLPIIALFVWLLVGTVFVTAFMDRSDRAELRPRVAAVFFILSSLVVMVQSYHAAFGWQGRYWYPAVAAVLVLLVPTLSAERISTPSGRRAFLLVAITTQVISWSSLVYNMWRYRFGFHEPFIRFQAIPYPWQPPQWSPSGGASAFYVASFVALATGVLILCMLPARVVDGSPPESALAREPLPRGAGPSTTDPTSDPCDRQEADDRSRESRTLKHNSGDTTC